MRKSTKKTNIKSFEKNDLMFVNNRPVVFYKHQVD